MLTWGIWWLVSENAHMGDLVVGEDHVGTAAHDDKVLPPGHVADQLTLVEKDRLRLGQAVVAAELPDAGLESLGSLHRHGVLIQILGIGLVKLARSRMWSCWASSRFRTSAKISVS